MIMMTRKKMILACDFDGCVHAYDSPWTDAVTISDGPVPGALRWLWKATEFFDVQIYSSRSKDPEARRAMFFWMVKHAQIEFGPDHPMADGDEHHFYPIGFAHEKPAAFLTIDDRALCFHGDWDSIDPAHLLNFKPWNKIPADQQRLGRRNSFPSGKISEDDEGAVRMKISETAGGLVHLDFGTPVVWLALPKDQAKGLAAMLLKAAGDVKGH